ncbi:biotin transporter BioY [Pseudodesulfovibrio tunisiensis]|uniref:biotin transporter BioY n=1 Tax=Pseudodesulfovibrio tunisiensis TaxID=463192 RepID=UPI001FB475EC|nr:biotin transporter BioY [Pseudodesulfovibrio tunisiensis]
MPYATLNPLHRMVWTALMASAVAVGAYLVIPIGPVPVSMQPFFVFLAGYALGPKRGAMAVGLYLIAGAIGLPVFARGGAGLGYVMGPTGGYLFGFLASAWLCGMARKGEGTPWIRGLVWGAVALVAVYGIGMAWLALTLDISWGKALAVGVAPFIPWDALKIVAAVACWRYLSRFRLLPEA